VTEAGASAPVTPNDTKFSAGVVAEKEISAGISAKVSDGKRGGSAGPKRRRKRALNVAEKFPELQINVDDATLFELISAGKVGVHKNGSRQKKRGATYDYRSHYRALRLNSGGREVLAFGTPEKLAEKLAHSESRPVSITLDPRSRLGRNAVVARQGRRETSVLAHKVKRFMKRK
jgi:hypothetical protein